MSRVVGISGRRERTRQREAPVKHQARRAAARAGEPPARWLGTRLKHARLVKQYRIRDVADRVGCSMSVISKIENGKVTPSLTLLHRIVGVLEINMGALFDAGDAEEGAIQRGGTRPVIAIERDGRGAGVQLERLVPYGDGHLLQGNIHIVAPGSGSEGGLEHEGEEVGYVLEGRITLTLDDTTYELEAGDSFVFRSNRLHGYRNPGTTPARILWINTPPTF
ncbi:MAG: cupin domain-containing protein [Thermodesulfobacteriota bacterium]